jgi:hypothetical protein
MLNMLKKILLAHACFWLMNVATAQEVLKKEKI